MKKVWNKLLLLSVLVATTFTACSGNASDDDQIEENVNVAHNVALENDLIGTTWVQTKRIIGDKNMELAPRTLTFTDEQIGTVTSFGGYNYRFKSGSKYAGLWYVSADNRLCMTSLYNDFDATGRGENTAYYGTHGNGSDAVKISMLNSTTLSYYWANSEYERHEWYYKRVSGSGNESGGSSTSYEKPDIALEDYTCYTTSITLKYRIYNQDKAKVTSAKGYYGTTSASKSVTASVAGSLITVRITGLKKGTTYYVKCSATGKGGTTTSESTKLITNF